MHFTGLSCNFVTKRIIYGSNNSFDTCSNPR